MMARVAKENPRLAGGSVLGLQLPLAVALATAAVLLALVGSEARARSLEQIRLIR